MTKHGYWYYQAQIILIFWHANKLLTDNIIHVGQFIEICAELDKIDDYTRRLFGVRHS